MDAAPPAGYWTAVSSHRHRIAHLVVVLVAMAGCSLQIPADPDGTLDTVTRGVLRVGASPQDDLVRAEDGTVSGSEADLVEGFAESLDARVEWTVGGEEHLVGELEKGNLDLVIGGLTDQTPWADKVGMTRAYPNLPEAEGRALVMLVPPGENRFLSELERYLDKETD